jgi:hypothetical protein
MAAEPACQSFGVTGAPGQQVLMLESAAFIGKSGRMSRRNIAQEINHPASRIG